MDSYAEQQPGGAEQQGDERGDKQREARGPGGELPPEGEQWHFTGDPDVFLGRAGEFLTAEPALHTVLLSVLDTLRTAGLDAYGQRAPLFGDRTDAAGDVIGAFVWTPPHPLQLSAVSAAAAAELAGHLEGEELDGVSGVFATAEAFAGAWYEQSGCGSELQFHQRLYRLGVLSPPVPAPPGRARIATRADRGLLMRWYTEFVQGAGHGDSADPGEWVDRRLAYGGLTLWEGEPDASGVPEPLAMAGRTRETAGQVRIAPVYTPRELRGRGYAGAVTAEVSRMARATGADEVLLFTDLANPTSNSLYQRLGYRPVRDFAVIAFTGGGQGT
ncbi:GNAT family N-acetyltransferase [Streptomyces triticagri]|uniref:GNAT family N-acetyltransferase n=1 Tax=Streptomyces triticagri TaxID=2293568 RepID=A0A372M7X7_9ACTN|nr:GNAT family N-acetyltransferase [Streptomyces triticagri]RFU86397.1 GNAT family N-acetyltransferase [Streptomyces triticagri]